MPHAQGVAGIGDEGEGEGYEALELGLKEHIAL